MSATKVGIREFRENLATYLESKTPIAITRHGGTIGVFVPTSREPSDDTLEALRRAGEKVQSAIAAAGASEMELVEEIKQIRRQARKAKS
jgi:antitoxin (DNA-binding transcriptional repressor) of toxin-antitoxin stability system